MISWLLEVIKITCKVSESENRSIIWRQKIPIQRNGGIQNRIAVKNVYTRNTSIMARNEKKVRTICTCDPNLWPCKSCHTYNVMDNKN